MKISAKRVMKLPEGLFGGLLAAVFGAKMALKRGKQRPEMAFGKRVVDEGLRDPLRTPPERGAPV